MKTNLFAEALMRRFSEILLTAAIVLLASPLFAQISVPEIAFDSAPNLLKMPVNVVMGESVGVAKNSKSLLFWFSRADMLGTLGGTLIQFVTCSTRHLYDI